MLKSNAYMKEQNDRFSLKRKRVKGFELIYEMNP